jgi:hypothetical protein
LSRTFNDTLAKDAAAAASNRFFGETILHYPAGDLAAGETIENAIVDRDAEDAGGVGSGEGAQYDRAEGVNLRRTALLEISIDVEVTEDSGRASTPSLFEFGGERWRTVRIIGRDAAMQTVLVTRNDKLAKRRVTR